jgi:hypothetical protein
MIVPFSRVTRIRSRTTRGLIRKRVVEVEVRRSALITLPLLLHPCSSPCIFYCERGVWCLILMYCHLPIIVPLTRIRSRSRSSSKKEGRGIRSDVVVIDNR